MTADIWFANGFARELVPVCGPDCKYVSPKTGPCQSQGKAVHLGAWQSTTFAPGDFKKWPNLGLRTRYTPVIDIDVDDVELVRTIECVAREHFGTTARRTRSNSPRSALLYRLEGERFSKAFLSFTTASGAAAKIEVLGDGQQLVVEGTHKSGARIKWETEPHPESLAPMSRETRDDFLKAARGTLEMAGCTNIKLSTSSDAPTGEPVPDVASVDPAVYERGCQLARSHPIAIDGDVGHTVTFQLALDLVRGLALGKTLGLKILREVYNPRLPQRWTEGELLHKAESAATDGRRPPGWLLPEPTPALEARTLTLERVKNPPTEKFLVGALFPFGKASVLYGPTGAGKSALLQGLAFKTASGGGGSFLGMLMHDQDGGPVLIYTAEDTFEDWERKAATILHGCPDIDMERAISRIHIIDKSEGEGRLTETVQVRTDLGDSASITRNERRPTPERLALIELAKRIKPRLIIIETTSRLVDKEANEDFSGLLSACGHIAAETGAAIILSHHPTKAASKDNDSSKEGVRGGGALIDNARCAVSLFPAEENVVADLKAKGLLFAAADTLLLEHQKGTSSVPKQAPIVLVRCPTPYGALLQTPELATANPQRAREMAMRADRQARAELAQRRRLVELVDDMRQAGPVSPRKIRDYPGAAARVGISGARRFEAFIGEAIKAGVLVPLRQDKNGKILDLGIGPNGRTSACDPACDPGGSDA